MPLQECKYPGAIAFGGPAVSHGFTYAGQRVGAELASRGLDRVVRSTFQFADGAAVPMAAMPIQFWRAMGTASKISYDKIKPLLLDE